MKIRKACILILLVILVLFLTGCSNKNDKNGEDLHGKVNTEIQYLSNELIIMMSKLNNVMFSNYMVNSREVDITSKVTEQGSSSSKEKQQSSNSEGESSQNNNSSSENGGGGSSGGDGNKGASGEKINVTEMVAQPSLNINYDDINWTEISTMAETFYTSWNTIILDLYKLNVNSQDITNFSSGLDQLIINIKAQDKVATLSSATNLYSYLPKYLEAYSTDSALKDLSLTKMHVLNAYVATTADNWDVSNNEMVATEQAFTNVMKNSEFVSQKEYNVNKVYIALKELQNSNQYQDKTLFFLKYKNLMQEISVI